MSELPILFSAPMVRGLLREIEQPGTGKTQTRRIYFPRHPWDDEVRRTEVNAMVWPIGAHGQQCGAPSPLPRYHVGDRLYVREEYYQLGHWEPVSGRLTAGGRQKWAFVPDDPDILFSAPGDFRLGRHHRDPGTSAWHKRLGRFMPRWASRITLTVTDVRVERLQEISEADAWAEGCVKGDPDDAGGFFPAEEPDPSGIGHRGWDNARDWYTDLWDTINGPGSWDANPWVAAYTFTVALGNIDQIGRAE